MRVFLNLYFIYIYILTNDMYTVLKKIYIYVYKKMFYIYVYI